MAKSLNDFLPIFERLTKKPEDYLSVQDSVAADVREFLKVLYDFTKCMEDGLPSGDALPELIIRGFDEEQIWQELELQNEGRSQGLMSDVATLVAQKYLLKFPFILKSEESMTDDGELQTDGDLASAADSETDISAVMEPEMKKSKVQRCPSVVDDQFFKLSELECFLEHEDKREAGQHSGSSDESVDLFQPLDDDTDEEAEGPHYGDFFDAPLEGGEVQNLRDESDSDWMEVGENDEDAADGKFDAEEEIYTKKVRFHEARMFDKENEAEEAKSSLERRQERLRARLDDLEEQALAEKPWQLKGEVSASARPQNSLLEEVVEFDLTMRPAPVITEQTTLQLEDIIRQRVKDRAWDDVEKKVKPVETPNEYKKKLVLDHEKSKLSLARIYEQDYIKQHEAQEAAPQDGQPQEEPPEHHTVRIMMASVFSMLDALSNFYFTPKPPAPEVKIVSNIPAISLEEVAPVATSDAALLAPEEVQGRLKGDLIGKAERTSSDKKRERRHKKVRQRERQRDRDKRERAVEKLRPGLGNKYSKAQALRDLEKATKNSNMTQVAEKPHAKAIRSSSAFFSRLQDEVRSHIKMKTAGSSQGQQKDVRSAKRMKL
ncbi:U3 small nucleolar ribonucleoprotein protein MPP10 isoform X2 [Cryptotermes secundus]|uniref:U3 small nucleolar ribonucleoprotein protein MPP10 isoform X2 n=1 Tax=Cryptotermes secundus TaxID=105785 RepID=UPI001454BDF8|nr:U3 small nucleolar ribonucleoprotein protein MPP10 isoform X2 [Cryptotermes secundus]